ncbi:hypothetical protein GETHLI_34070 [Geothrix limicola]|uniref:Uncharacterized protein n=1 Tax=Geothrix limicola TaxID=2927978 RepID=A0ABQ5QJ57_9BACT|nr:hypothetical protein [Geothrix limicola]GLH74905.1 hypothetical protein GETHLI_34070 [Geothrix limicola]
MIPFRKFTNSQKITLWVGGIGAILTFIPICINLYQLGASHREFVRQNDKLLYDRGAEALKSIHQAYGELLSILANPDFGVPTSIYDPAYQKIGEATFKLGEFNQDLARLTDQRKVQAGEEVYSWAQVMLVKASLHRQRIESVEKATTELVSCQKREGAFYSRLQRELNDNIEELIRSENELYFSLRDFDLEALGAVEQGVNISFKEALSLAPVPSMYEQYARRQVLMTKAKAYRFKASEASFVIARVRAYTDPEYLSHDQSTLSRDTAFYRKLQVMNKFIVDALKKNPKLNQSLPPHMRLNDGEAASR